MVIVGKNSSFYKLFKKKDCKLVLDTLYCGHPKKNPCVIVFYNKKKESSKRHINYLDNTRVEIRLYAGKTEKYTFLINKLLESVTYKEKGKMGEFLRHSVFTQLLFSHINFSTIQRATDTFKSIKSWAGWWEELFKVKYKACLANQSEFEESLPSILANLRLLKKTPSLVFSLFDKELSKIVVGSTHDIFNVSNPLCLESMPTPLMITSGLNGKEVLLLAKTKKSRGRPKGSLDKKKFEKRGRPKK